MTLAGRPLGRPYERLAANCGLRDALWASPTNG